MCSVRVVHNVIVVIAIVEIHDYDGGGGDDDDDAGVPISSIKK